MKACPAREVLERLLANGLADTEFDEIEQHVEDCADCQRTLEDLTDGAGGAKRGLVVRPLGATASLGHVGRGSTEVNNDSDRAASYAVGTATSDGQRFRVLRPHARRGLGAVFVALDSELNREVALKQILDHHADDPVSRQRFLLEAMATGGLEHPGIVPVYGLGTYGDGRPYYAMRFIRGDSLKEAVAAFHADETLRSDPGRRSLGLLKLLRRFLAVCDAIDYAHSRGVLHRDLKPSNVVLGKHGETLVVDWGLAKAVGVADPVVASDERPLVLSSSSAWAETLPGSALGTPSYMSPEQAGGDLQRVGPRSDVYSLGTTLYCLLTGRPPVEGDDPVAVLRVVQRGDFPPPRRLDPSIDPALDAVCLKAMALRPEDRYPTPRALAEDIEHWMADEPVSAWREPRVRRARRWERRHRTAVTATASGLLVALAGMLSVLLIQARAYSDLTRSNAALSAANERERARFALAMDAVKLFHGEVSEEFLLKEKPFAALRTKLLRSAADFYIRLEGLLKVQADRPSRTALARAYDELGELTEKIGSQLEALAAHRRALAVRRELADSPQADAATRADVARSLLAVGLLQHRTADKSAALASFEEARRLADGLIKTVGEDERLQAVLGLAYQRIARVLEDSGAPAEALEASRQSIAIMDGLADAHPDVAEFQSNLRTAYTGIGGLLLQLGKQADALHASKRALAIEQKLVDAHPDSMQFQSDLAHCHDRIGYELQLAGKPAEAQASFEQSLAIRQNLAHANPNVTTFQFHLSHIQQVMGWALRKAGKPAEALVAFQGAVAIMRRLVETNPEVTQWQSELALGLFYVGSLGHEAGRPDEGVASVRQAVTIWTRLASPAPTDLYNLTCAHAALAGFAAKAGSGVTAAEGRSEAERAMESLRRAVAAGYRKLTMMRTDNDLDPLRDRPDFQLLLMDLAFPPEPFTGPR